MCWEGAIMEIELTPIEKAFLEAGCTRIATLLPQQWVGPYRVDFLIPHKRLVIELDGHASHSSRADRTKDAIRQRHLQKLGFTVIRFTGTEVYEDVETCICETIDVLNGLSECNSTTPDAVPDFYYCTRMQEVVSHLLDRHGIDVNQPYSHVEMTMGEGWDNLVIGREGPMIGVFHYFMSGSKVFFDPLIEFIIVRDPSGYEEWMPAQMYTPFGSKPCAELDDDDKVVVFEYSIQGQIASYAENWARNLRVNGWVGNSIKVEI